jgi:hypothetical protein
MARSLPVFATWRRCDEASASLFKSSSLIARTEHPPTPRRAYNQSINDNSYSEA